MERLLNDGEYKFARQMDYVFVYAVCNLRTTRVIHTRYKLYTRKKAQIRPIVMSSMPGPSAAGLWILFLLSYSSRF